MAARPRCLPRAVRRGAEGGAEQKAARSAHNEVGAKEVEHDRHHYQLLFAHPLQKLDMAFAGVDMLHLVYLNLFKHLFRYTPSTDCQLLVRICLRVGTKNRLVRDYFRNAGFYLYDAARAQEKDPVKRWIDPAAPPRHVSRHAAAFQRGGGDRHGHRRGRRGRPVCRGAARGEAGGAVDDDQRRSVGSLPRVCQVDSTTVGDGGGGHELRTACTPCRVPPVPCATAAMRVTTNLLELKPTLSSWVPHIAVFIVPRQTLLLGDPSRRSYCDTCESLGAVLKKKIKHLTCRRRICDGTLTLCHATAKGEIVWQQSLSVGYIEPVFTGLCVSEKLKHWDVNQPYLQRVDARRKVHGMSLNNKKVLSAAEEPTVPPSVRDAMPLDE
eukprot:6207960-Pleurochrysis_carterae.AAC.1